MRISSEGSNSPVTSSPNANAKAPKKTRGPNKLKGYLPGQSSRLELRHNERGQVVDTN